MSVRSYVSDKIVPPDERSPRETLERRKAAEQSSPKRETTKGGGAPNKFLELPRLLKSANLLHDFVAS